MSKRITIDLTDRAEAEIERLRNETGLSTADIFRYSLTLFRIYRKAVSGGDQVFVVKNGTPITRIELPPEFPERKVPQ